MRRTLIMLVAILLVTLAACSGRTQTASTEPIGSNRRLLAIYAGGEPGTPYATAALEWAANAGFDAVLNYSLIDASPEAIASYVSFAHQLGLKVIVSLQDLLGDQDRDQDPVDQQLHRQFGMTTNTQVLTIVSSLKDNPAVWGFSISDELPDSPDSLAQWKPALQKRQAEIKKLTTKPTLVTLTWSPDSENFYKTVASTTTDLAIDYYPLPTNSTYGSVDSITTIGQTLQSIVGSHGWLTLQAFGWGDACNVKDAADLHFPLNASPPSTQQMVSMAQMAVQGGARNIIVYSYDDNAPAGCGPSSPGNPGQLAAIVTAVHQITTSNWWK